MSGKLIQEQFGDKVIEAFADFAREDLDTPEELEGHTFDHVVEPKLRKELCQVFYGARWIYKLGLALLTKEEERAAHVRAQIVDYAAVCEALLSYSLTHAIRRRYTTGDAYKWNDPHKRREPLIWDPANPERVMAKRSMWWLIEIARSFNVVNTTLQTDLQWLREQRNTVHLRARAALGPTAFLNQSKRAFQTTTQTIAQTKNWYNGHR